MQYIFNDDQNFTPRSEVLFLPIIDLNPSDKTCIYSTLIYVESQAKKLNIPTPCITFDQPEEVGRKIQKHLDNISVLEASIKKSEQVKSLNHLYPGIQVDKEKVQINPTLLFSRLIAIVQREEDITPYFDYELTAIPTSLFKDHAMRKTTKAQLAKALMSNVQPSQRNTQIHHVLDGGALIHRVKWPKGATYSEIAKTYVSYVHQHYCIIFDGYKQGPSIKDHEHQRRL